MIQMFLKQSFKPKSDQSIAKYFNRKITFFIVEFGFFFLLVTKR